MQLSQNHNKRLAAAAPVPILSALSSRKRPPHSTGKVVPVATFDPARCARISRRLATNSRGEMRAVACGPSQSLCSPRPAAR
jgi:hypothetical protein